MNVMIGHCTTPDGENWPVYVDAEREAFIARCVERVGKGTSRPAGSLCEPPGAPSTFEPNCPLGAFLNAAPTYLTEAVLQRRELLGTVGRGSEAPRRDGPEFEHFPESQNPGSVSGKPVQAGAPSRPARRRVEMIRT